MRDIAVLSIARTPVGRSHKGNLRDTRPDTLAGLAAKAAVSRAKGLTKEELGDLILGCAMPEAEQGMNVARQAAFIAGIPYQVPSMTINRFCCSGIQSMAIAAGRIALGGIETAVAGGTESMTMVPLGGNKPAFHPDLVDDYPDSTVSMGITAENVARKFDVTRADQDEFAYNSHMRAVAAQKAGKFQEEIVPVQTVVYEEGGAREVTVAADECPRADTSLEKLAKLRPAFHKNGTVTAGNSSPLNDGAATAILGTTERAKQLGIKPMALFRNYVVVGVPPEVMGIGPVPAIRKLLEVSGLKRDQIDIFEINEAFAAQAVYCVRELGIDPAKVNPNGGAIALGHPLGATGAVLATKLLYDLRRTQKRFGVVSMCIGGGMGAAALFERI